MGDRAVPLHHIALNECEANDGGFIVTLASYQMTMLNLYTTLNSDAKKFRVEHIKDLMPIYNRNIGSYMVPT